MICPINTKTHREEIYSKSASDRLSRYSAQQADAGSVHDEIDDRARLN